MKGVILAGGRGTRLYPLTETTNKHLLPVYDRAMICYPVECLVNAGITDVMVVTGGTSIGDIMTLLTDGRQFGLRNLVYACQEKENGIAGALKFARAFAGEEKVVVVLGDNILERSIEGHVRNFARQVEGAKILLKEVDDPHRFGVARVENGRLISIEEKPIAPFSHFAVTGIYMYPPEVFDIIDGMTPSPRGELEITDVNNAFISKGLMTFDFIEGWWADAGTFESLHRASCLVARGGANKIDELVNRRVPEAQIRT